MRKINRYRKNPSDIKELEKFFIDYKGGNKFLDSIRDQSMARGVKGLSQKQFDTALRASRSFSGVTKSSRELNLTFSRMFYGNNW